jgi:DNA polymerase-3 subunit delta'
MGDGPGPIWEAVVGQPAAVATLRTAAADGAVHAYMFVGPPGSSKLQAARAFAAQLVTEAEAADSRDSRLILTGTHPDVIESRRTGAAILAEQAAEIVRLSSLAPIESGRKVMILDEFHLLAPASAVRLLKTIEEPPASTTFIILCDFVPTELVTIASRCVRVDFRPLETDVIAAQLVAEGVDPAHATAAAASALGDLDRARLLANDPELARRRDAFANVAHELDGTGSVALRCASNLLDMIDESLAPLVSRHEADAAALAERIASTGDRGSGRKDLEDLHKRELRRHRTDELRAGLATLAATYRDSATDAATSGAVVDIDNCAAAIHRIHGALESLDRNPNERLLIESLLWSLPDVHGIG